MEELLLKLITSQYAPAYIIPITIVLFLIRVRIWRILGSLYTFISQIINMPASILEIRSELHPNSGKSLRDAVTFLTEQSGICMVSIQIIQDQIGIAQSKADSSGNITWVNRHYIELTGKAPESLEGSGWVNIIHPDDRHMVFGEWQEAIKQDREYRGSFRIIGAGNETICVDAHGYPVRDIKGKIVNFSGYIIRSDQTRAKFQASLTSFIDKLNTYVEKTDSIHNDIKTRLDAIEQKSSKTG